MKLVNSNYGLSIEMKEGITDILVIENPKCFADIVNDIFMQQNGDEGDFILSEDNKEIAIQKVLNIIINPFSLDFNEKRIVSKLYRDLTDVAMERIQEYSEINYKIVNELERITSVAGYSGISYNFDFDWKSLFKLYDVRIENNYETLIEKLIEYVKISSILCNIKVIVFVNLKDMLIKSELDELYKTASSIKIQLILIESCEKIKEADEHIYIIDNDMCIIEKL